MLDCFLNYSVNPNLRFHSRIDKIIDDVIREKINIPHNVICIVYIFLQEIGYKWENIF